MVYHAPLESSIVSSNQAQIDETKKKKLTWRHYPEFTQRYLK